MWIGTDEHLPEDETPVLVVCNGSIQIAEIRWEHPTFEETFKAFRYWDDPINDGQIIEWLDVTHWQSLPELPEQNT